MNLATIMNMFGGQNSFMQRLNVFGQQFSKQNACTPEQKVQQLLNSGQMSQEQFNAYAQMANQLTGRRF